MNFKKIQQNSGSYITKMFDFPQNSKHYPKIEIYMAHNRCRFLEASSNARACSNYRIPTHAQYQTNANLLKLIKCSR